MNEIKCKQMNKNVKFVTKSFVATSTMNFDQMHKTGNNCNYSNNDDSLFKGALFREKRG